MKIQDDRDHGLVSVIVPVYNVSQYIKCALESLINQTYKNIEIIVIDDGSTDSSGHICDAYSKKDKRIRVIHQENKGLSAARNIGLAMMKGEMVAFLDSDDAVHPKFIYSLVTAMIKENTDLVLCKYGSYYTNHGIIYNPNIKLHPSIEPGILANSKKIISSLIDNEINVNIWNKLYKKELWKDVRFVEGHVFEDAEVSYIIFSRCKRIYVLDDQLYFERKRPGSITDTLSIENINDRLLAQYSVENYVQSRTPEVFSVEQLNKCRRRRYNVLIRCYGMSMQIRENASCKSTYIYRNEIIETRKTIDINGCSSKTKILCWIAIYYPRLLRTLFTLYRMIKYCFHRIKHIENTILLYWKCKSCSDKEDVLIEDISF